MLMQILAGTPKWVFVVFFVLLWYGCMQSETREAGKPRVLMLPIIMTILSLGGVLSSFGAGVVHLLSWLAGFVLSIAINRVVRAPAGVRFDPTTRKFHLPGSWIPLLLMMAIYFSKYVVGATTALRPDIAHSIEFAVVLSLIFGVLSGGFFARFLQIWSHQSGAAASTVGATGLESTT